MRLCEWQTVVWESDAGRGDRGGKGQRQGPPAGARAPLSFAAASGRRWQHPVRAWRRGRRAVAAAPRDWHRIPRELAQEGTGENEPEEGARADKQHCQAPWVARPGDRRGEPVSIVWPFALRVRPRRRRLARGEGFEAGGRRKQLLGEAWRIVRLAWDVL